HLLLYTRLSLRRNKRWCGPLSIYRTRLSIILFMLSKQKKDVIVLEKHITTAKVRTRCMSIRSKKSGTESSTEEVQGAELFRALIENSLDGIVLYDACGTITYASPSTERITGYSPEEFVGLNGFSLIHPDDLELVREAINTINDT